MQTNVQREAHAPIADGVVIRTEGLTKVYDTGVTAVDHLDLDVHEGEIFGLLGPNGAGKTTTVGMLTTRVIPTEGRATVAGVDVVAHPSDGQGPDRRRVADQHARSQPHGLGEPLLPRPVLRDGQEGVQARRRRRCSRSSGSPTARTPTSSTLSGGMAQRLMVARSIVHRPRTLFLDEPTSGLDPQSRIALWEIIGQIHAEGQTIVLTTHYMEEADQLCERVAIMDHGKLLALDTPDGLKRSVGGDSVVKIKAGDRARQPGGAPARHRTASPAPRSIGETVQLTAKGSEGLLPRIIATAEAGGFTVHDVSIDEPTLETVFINLTGKDLRE